MPASLEARVGAIVHQTEDAGRVIAAFGLLGLAPGEISTARAEGHYENRIEVAEARVSGRRAAEVVKALLSRLPPRQVDELAGQVAERTDGSRFHLRLDKQELVRGRAVLGGPDPVRVSIRAPVYAKRDAAPAFERMLRSRGRLNMEPRGRGADGDEEIKAAPVRANAR